MFTMFPTTTPVPVHPLLHGRVLLTGHSPDGDSVRFVPHDLGSSDRCSFESVHDLHVAADGSVQLRLQGIDAPELHYVGHAQPRAIQARDGLLRWLGFNDVVYSAHGQVQRSGPLSVDAAVLARTVDARGRLIAWLMRPCDVEGLPATEVLARSANAFLLRRGLVYPLAYTSLPRPHKDLVRALAAHARRDRLGVWANDVTRGGFVVDDLGALGRELVLPKLFRRAVDYLGDRADGFRGRFRAWLLDNAEENDALVLPGSRSSSLHDILARAGDRMRMIVDPLDVTFVER